MTIKKYLNKRIRDIRDGQCNSSIVQGKLIAFEEILGMLPELEHDVTLKEVQEICDKVREAQQLKEEE